MFDDDWEASEYLYPVNSLNVRSDRPPITLLVITIDTNVIFDPSKEELAVAEAVVAISVRLPTDSTSPKVLTMRTIDPPSRLTPPGIPNSINTATGGATVTHEEAIAAREGANERGVWAPPRGGLKRGLIGSIIKAILGPGGVAQEVMDGLNSVET
jgi:exosome complex component RRP42